ncbi:beta-phosphoglucomutase family hydrolase [bacterium]|nr:beta-phosphoglucomutase family hydrolase [bacterium]
MAELKAVLFDLDGVLVDSHRLHYRSWQQLADELGLHFNEQLGDRYRGMERYECMRIMFEEFNHRPAPDRRTIHELTERKNAYYQKLLEHAGPEDLVLPGSVELLEALRAAQITAVVASGSKNAHQVIDHAGIRGYLDAVVDRYDVAETKPDPAIFRVALDKAGVPAAHAVGVEDAVLGVESLHRAGIKAIGVGHYVKDADLVVDAIRHLTVGMMRRVLE